MRSVGVRVLRSDLVHLNVSAPGITVLSTVGSGGSRVVVRGDLDMMTVCAFHLVVDHILDVGAPRIAVDLAGVDFLGAAGINAFHHGDERCRQAAGRLWLDEPTPQVRRLLAVIGSDGLLEPG